MAGKNKNIALMCNKNNFDMLTDAQYWDRERAKIK